VHRCYGLWRTLGAGNRASGDAVNARQLFTQCLQERRQFKRGTLDWVYLTAAARTYLNIIRNIPTTEWKK
jgi:hypothetical protein